MELLSLVIMAILVEAIVEILKTVYDENGINKTSIVSIIVGILLAITTQLDLLALLGVNAVLPYVGIIASGLIISRGSNFVHDLIRKLKGSEKDQIEVI